MIEEQFLTKSKFTKLVEATVLEKQLTYMDAILWLCEQNNIEPLDVKKFVSNIIKDKVEAEARKLNFLPKQNALEEFM
jgi:hypothetical protein